MTLYQILQVIISGAGFLTGILAYIFHYRIKSDILQNNEKLNKTINQLHSSLTKSLEEEHESIEDLRQELIQLSSSLPGKIMSTVNGKYTRIELHNALKELIESNMSRIEKGLDRQIDDLKSRMKDCD